MLLMTSIAFVAGVAAHYRITAYLRQDPNFGVLVAPELRQRLRLLDRRRKLIPTTPLAVVFADIDYLHEANERLGYAAVDKGIREALRTRRSDRLPVPPGRIGGDELCLVCRSDTAIALCKRIQSDLKWHGLSATFAIAEVSASVEDALRSASDICQEAKRRGERGTISVF